MSPPGDSKGGGTGMTTNMVTTVLAFSVSAFFVLFVFVRLLCARLHLRTDHHTAAAAARAGDAFVVQTYNVGRGIRGLEPSVVTGFPTVKLGDGAPRSPGQESSQCTVCLEEYAAKDVVRVLPACGHAFHASCIDAWLRQQPTCPVCRASLRANKNQNHHPPLDHGLAAAAVAVAPASRPQVQVPASTSGVNASSPPPAPADQTRTGSPHGHQPAPDSASALKVSYPLRDFFALSFVLLLVLKCLFFICLLGSV